MVAQWDQKVVCRNLYVLVSYDLSSSLIETF